MKENVILTLLIVLVLLFVVLIATMPKALDHAVAQSMETYLELNGYVE